MKKENDQLHKYIVTGVAFTHKNCVFDGGKNPKKRISVFSRSVH